MQLLLHTDSPPRAPAGEAGNRRLGGKRNLARRIIARLADIPHTTYVEPFRAVLGNVEEKTLLDLLPTRSRTEIGAYMEQRLDRDRVEVVCQDMYREYRAMARKHLPKAQIVVDKFHVIAKANDAVEMFRRSLNAHMNKADRVKLKNQRKILLARNHTLKPSTRVKLEHWLEQFPELARVYWIKEEFYGIYEANGRAEAERRLDTWMGLLRPEHEPYFKVLLQSLDHWRDGIFAYFDHRYTNAYVESVNRFLSSMQRDGRGYSFEVIRAKALLAHGHQRRMAKEFTRDRSANYKPPSYHSPYFGTDPSLHSNFGADLDKLSQSFTTHEVHTQRSDGQWVRERLPSGISTWKLDPDELVVEA